MTRKFQFFVEKAKLIIKKTQFITLFPMTPTLQRCQKIEENRENGENPKNRGFRYGFYSSVSIQTSVYMILEES